MRALVLLLLVQSVCCMDNSTLLTAFAEVFDVHDMLLDPDTAVMRRAVQQLGELGVPSDMDLCNLDERVKARVLMRAALGNLQLGMRDDTDWSVIVADVSTGQLIRVRSFSAVRFAVIESLLLVAIVALGRAIWIKSI